MNRVVAVMLLAIVMLASCFECFGEDVPVFTDADLGRYSNEQSFKQENGRLEVDMEEPIHVSRVKREVTGRPAIAGPHGSISGPGSESVTTHLDASEEPDAVEAPGPDTVREEAPAPDVITESDKREAERDIRFIVDAMINCLSRGDIDGALAYFIPDMRQHHRTVFEILKKEKSLVAAMKGYRGIHLESYYGNFAQVGAIREEANGTYSYPVMLVKDERGKWWIRSF